MHRMMSSRKTPVAAAPASRRSSARGVPGWPAILIAGGLLVAAWIHLVLVPEHLGEAFILGLGFLAAAIAQLGLAAIVVRRPTVGAFAGVVSVNGILIVIYAYAVVVGLPFEAGHEA